MAQLIAGDARKAPFAGDVGNKGVWSGYYKYPVAGANGDTIDLFEVPAGARVFEVGVANSAFGAGVTLSLGWKYKDGSAGGTATALMAATSVATAGSLGGNILPIDNTGSGKSMIVYATIGGGNPAANSEVFARVEGEFVGTK